MLQTTIWSHKTPKWGSMHFSGNMLGERYGQGYCWRPIGSRIRAFDWCSNQWYDLGWPWRAITHSVPKHVRLSAPMTKIWMKIDPYCQQRWCSPMILDSGSIRFVRIFAGVPWRVGVKRQWGCRKRHFSVLSHAISSEALELRQTLSYNSII